jgi:hypothetical protein
MSIKEIADKFTAKIPEDAAKDFYDRFLDLAIFINETCEDGEFKESAISKLGTALGSAYKNKRL